MVLLLFVPLLGSYIFHAPVLRFDLFPSLTRPLDMGLSWRGHRLFGDNKTIRGAIVMFLGALVMTYVLRGVPFFWAHLPQSVQEAGPGLYGSILGLGMVLGELPNSFIKRQLGIKPGSQQKSIPGFLISLFDQADFVILVFILLFPICRVPIVQMILAFFTVVGIHLVINIIGYAIGARKNLL